jgi:hypothetical protein
MGDGAARRGGWKDNVLHDLHCFSPPLNDLVGRKVNGLSALVGRIEFGCWLVSGELTNILQHRKKKSVRGTVSAPHPSQSYRDNHRFANGVGITALLCRHEAHHVTKTGGNRKARQQDSG